MFRRIADRVRGWFHRRPPNVKHSPSQNYPFRSWLGRNGLERLEDRACPATWTDYTGNEQFGDLGNWVWGPSETYGDLSMPRFTSAANGGSTDDCQNVSGSFSTFSVWSDYTGRITFSGPVTAYMFGLAGTATIDQPVSGTDLTVTGWFGWSGGTINSTTNLANLILSGATGSIYGGGTVNLGSNLSLVNGASCTMNSGTINVTNAATSIDIDQNCSFIVDTGSGLPAIIAGLPGPNLRLGSNASLTINPQSYFKYEIGKITNQGGTFSIGAEGTAIIQGYFQQGVPDSYYAYQQTAGATYLYGFSGLMTGVLPNTGISISGGILATKYAATSRSSNDCSATIITEQLQVTGGDIYIGYGASSHLAFGTIWCYADVSWTGGAYHPNLRSYGDQNNIGESDIWLATGANGGKFTVGGTAALAPILVDAEGAVYLSPPPSGVSWFLLQAKNGFAANSTFPSMDTDVWAIDPVHNDGVNNANQDINQWNLRAK